MEAHVNRQLAICLVVAVLSGFIGLGYAYLLSLIDDFTWDLQQASLAIVTGFSIGGSAMLIQLFLFKGVWASALRRRPYWMAVLIKLVIFWIAFGIILRLVRTGLDVIYANDLWAGIDASSIRRDGVFSLLVMSGFVFVFEVRALVGPSTFMGLLSGRYHQPRNENRIFMFVDVARSTQIAAQIGNEAFHDYLSDLFYEYDLIVSASGGEVVNYIGDAVLGAWPDRRPAHVIQAVRAGSSILKRTRDISGRIERKYGVRPKVRVVMHRGTVVIGETGANRRQITMLGDAVNITARLENVAKTTGDEFLISEAVKDRLAGAGHLDCQAIGRHQLKGVSEPMEIFRLSGTP